MKMNRIIDLLNLTINKEAKEKVLQCDEFIKIKELEPSAKLKEVEIRGFLKNDKIFAFSLDLPNKNSLSCYINRKNVNRGCDGIVFVIRENNLYIFVCELKSDRPHKKDFEKQLLSSEIFIYYLLKIFEKFDNLKINNITIKKILFSTYNSNKYKINNKELVVSKIKNDIYHNDCVEEIENIFKINELIGM